jgi:hypothetical protein
MDAIVFEPLVPGWALIAAAALACAATILGFIGAARGAPLRAVALAAIVALIANPQARTAERTALADIAVLVVDESASQSLDGRRTATADAARGIEERLKALGEIEIIRRGVFGEDETRIVEAIGNALADVPRGRIGGVFVLTDGQASDAARAPPGLPEAPIHLFISGRPGEIDRKITLIDAPRYGIVRTPVKISFRVDDVGPDGAAASEDGAAVVALRIDGKEALREAVPIGAEVSFDAPLDRPGALVVELETDAREGELTGRNNIAVLEISAVRDRLRVLLISGEPHAGERVWRNLLKSDPAVDLVHFTILRPIEKGSPTEETDELALIPFPQDELFIEKLTEFDLVIFDRYAYSGVLNAFHFDNIARFVESGGAVLVAAGPEFAGPESLATQRNFAFILPAIPAALAREEPFRPTIGELGRRHPATADLPEDEFWGRWLRIMPAAARSGSALMEGPDGLPLLILDRVGEGRVGLILSDHVWLWARGFDGGGPHAELLRRVAHWLMKEPELEEEQLSLKASGRDLVIARRTLANDPGPVELTLPDGSIREMALALDGPGRFKAALTATPAGLYRARSGDLFAVGAIGLAAAPEFQDVVSAPSKLAPLAKATRGGQFSFRRGDSVALPAIRRVGAGAASYAGPGWAGLVERRASRTDQVRDQPLAPPWAWLALIAAALAGAWAVEGRLFYIRRSLDK